VTVPLPEPDAPLVIEIQAADSVAVHAHPAVVVTVIELLDEPEPTDAWLGDTP
jgi:hypothetical protein